MMSTAAIQLLDIQRDQWLTDVVGFNVWRVIPSPRWQVASHALADELQCHSLGQARALYYTKIGVEQVPLLHCLNAAGMAVVDVNITLEIPAAQVMNQSIKQSDVQIVDCRPQDGESLVEIASTSFRFSRMHLDPLFPTQIANRVRNEWVRSYLKSERGDRLFVALWNGKAVGFLAALVAHADRQRIGVLDLMGVSADVQRRGVGVALVQHWLRHYATSCDILRVGTQAANIPALRLYEKCGMKTASSAYVLHRHVG